MSEKIERFVMFWVPFAQKHQVKIPVWKFDGMVSITFRTFWKVWVIVYVIQFPFQLGLSD